MCDAARGLVLLAMAGFVRCCCCCLVFRYFPVQQVTLDFSGNSALVQGSVEFPWSASLVIATIRALEQFIVILRGVTLVLQYICKWNTHVLV